MKRSLRDFFLTLLISVVIFAVAAFSLIGIAEGLMSDVVDKIDEAGEEGGESPSTTEGESLPVGGTPSQGIDPGASTKDRCVSFLLVGLDRQHNYADAIFLVGINTTRSQASVALIPSNTLVQEGSQKYRLSLTGDEVLQGIRGGGNRSYPYLYGGHVYDRFGKHGGFSGRHRV